MQVCATITSKDVRIVDLFCGIGGLTHGLVLEGLKVSAGVDNDPDCRYAFEENNDATFIEKDIDELSVAELKKAFGKSRIKVLVGCAPCQPFSSLSRRERMRKKQTRKSKPLSTFADLLKAVKPHVVSMENVPDLAHLKRHPVFATFVGSLKDLGYKVSYSTVDASRYGAAQKRRRLVLLASRLGEISLISPTHDEKHLVTVRHAIGKLTPIRAGKASAKDPMHYASELSELNRRRIMATPRNGGSAADWPEELLPKCYRRKSGHSYMSSVYGRMRWDEPAPTVTTNCLTLGAGRFGHPSQNRAMSLREAAIFQGFPRNYKFAGTASIPSTKIAQHIGNAVPVPLARAIGRSIRKHVNAYLHKARLPRS